MKREEGFTFVELLVVIIVIAVLAAIALPIFLNQREKSWSGQSQSALKNASVAIEAYAVATGGNYSGLDNANSNIPDNPGYAQMELVGFRKAPRVEIRVDVDDLTPIRYCITAVHERLSDDHPWKISTYSSDDGSPRPIDVDSCPGL